MSAQGDELTAPFVRLTAQDGMRLAETHWALHGTAVRLDSERDDTFRFDARDGTRYVLKVANPADRNDVVAMQCEALEHVAVIDPSLQVPRVVRSVSGETMVETACAEGERRTAQLLTWVPGSTLDHELLGDGGRRALGALVGRLSLALYGFEHRGAERVLAWDLQRLPSLRRHLQHLSADLRREVQAELDRFEAGTGPDLARVRQQIVHNDANPNNVVVDGNGLPTGILDFGDIARTAVVADLAVAMAYAVPSTERCDDPTTDPWAPAYDVAQGFHAVRPLGDDEISLLPHLVRARMVQVLLVSSWLAAANPDFAGRFLAAQRHSTAALRSLDVASAPQLGEDT